MENLNSLTTYGSTESKTVIAGERSAQHSVQFDSNQKRSLFCILTVSFASYVVYAVISPFYPNVALEKGLNQFQIDLVFSGYGIALVIASPLFGLLITWTGCKPMLLTGLALNGTANFLFGFIDSIPDAQLFFYISLLLRALEAFGTTAVITANYTYVIRMFPDAVGYVFGLTETAVGLGRFFLGIRFLSIKHNQS